MPFCISTLTLNSLPHISSINPKRTLRNQTVRSSSFPSISTKSTTMSMHTKFDLYTYWTSLISEINLQLDQAIPVKYPEQIYESMRYSVLATEAKRATPVMCIASCELFGGSRLAAFPTACALEMVHEASLIHDDLPYMDDDLFRRGRLSNHSVYGVDMAILAGDALFPLGFQHIVSNTPPGLVPETRLLRVVSEIARAVGSTGMAAGQFLDLNYSEESSVEFVQEKKFGELSECSAVCGGLLGGATDNELESLRRYGRTVGVLYQVVNDVLEFKREQAEGGGKKKGNSSFAKVFGVEKALEKAEELRVKAKKELDGFEKYGEKVFPLLSFVDYAVDRSFDVVGDHVGNGTLGVKQPGGMASL
ncbi:Geranylgeranyl pyrophosphate synthase protein [Thalictrum thalictroides]|uniref:Geranylgeranyl pyrophosphate synthase protein n=1 Tax=Thalictrum thalictroides TaxID=46969 RepID=A0A7J6WR58_THATH|nr:Geranylgeranyl pyrophosphate synthase protein [Thalictrum thalictroides]